MQIPIEKARISVSSHLPLSKKKQLGQFFTPVNIATFMADLFDLNDKKNIRLLDAGAGIGSLTAAFLHRCISSKLNVKKVLVDLFEIDPTLNVHLKNTLAHFRKHIDMETRIINDDFIEIAVNWLERNLFVGYEFHKYTHAILNPPYKKIRSNSIHRLKLRRIGIETVNLYTAFVALALLLLENNGELVAIVPRSFCNGLYYWPFRQMILEKSAITRIHLFHARNKAFKDDNVLQENIIIKLKRNGKQGNVIISTSTDDKFFDLDIFEVPFEKIVFPNDRQLFIHIPSSPKEFDLKKSKGLDSTLEDMGFRVSTGPVVDFRVKKYLSKIYEDGTVPLLYPTHFRKGKVNWPVFNSKKANAIYVNSHTEKWLYPNGYYCVIRRFSSKEEKRRIIASVIEPENFPGISLIGIENHLNVIHSNKNGLSRELAFGIAAYLNTKFVDTLFRSFSGHTQVNATDLKKIPFPKKNILVELGKFAIQKGSVESEEFEELLMEVIK